MGCCSDVEADRDDDDDDDDDDNTTEEDGEQSDDGEDDAIDMFDDVGWHECDAEAFARAAPDRVESRAVFLVCLRRTVTWIHKSEATLNVCLNQKVRVWDVVKSGGACARW